jgi:hypothetical protein
MDGKRADALTCSPACRKRLQRRRERGHREGHYRPVPVPREIRLVPPLPPEPVEVDPAPAF